MATEAGSDSTRQRIITATNELFRRVGYNGAGISEISRTSGATTGSIYHFFPGGKSELARAVVGETAAVYRELFELIADSEEDIADGVAALFEGAAVTLETDGFIDPCPIGTVAREVASTDDQLREATSLAFASWSDAVTARLVANGAEPADASVTANAVVGMLEGGFIIARVHRDAGVLQGMARQAAVLVEACVASGRDATNRSLS